MKIKIELNSHKQIILASGFLEYMQAFIYNHIDIDKAKWLHNFGFPYEKRTFKLFVFSSILERAKFNKEKKLFTFPNNISFYLASPVNWILEQTAKNILQSSDIMLGSNRLNVSSVQIHKKDKIKKNRILVQAITPIEVHSTITMADNKKRTLYFTPYNEEFAMLVNQNLQKKWAALYQKVCPYKLQIRHKFKGNRNEKIVYFGVKNKTIVKGWSGHFEIEAEPEFLEFALNVGLGSRNSQGFGFVVELK